MLIPNCKDGLCNTIKICRHKENQPAYRILIIGDAKSVERKMII